MDEDKVIPIVSVISAGSKTEVIPTVKGYAMNVAPIELQADQQLRQQLDDTLESLAELTAKYSALQIEYKASRYVMNQSKVNSIKNLVSQYKSLIPAQAYAEWMKQIDSLLE
ncbi:unnamed protein product [Sphagnum balticum]